MVTEPTQRTADGLLEMVFRHLFCGPTALRRSIKTFNLSNLGRWPTARFDTIGWDPAFSFTGQSRMIDINPGKSEQLQVPCSPATTAASCGSACCGTLREHYLRRHGHGLHGERDAGGRRRGAGAGCHDH